LKVLVEKNLPPEKKKGVGIRFFRPGQKGEPLISRRGSGGNRRYNSALNDGGELALLNFYSLFSGKALRPMLPPPGEAEKEARRNSVFLGTLGKGTALPIFRPRGRLYRPSAWRNVSFSTRFMGREPSCGALEER